ncbi:MAG: hypothetical protein MZV70_29605 [Desulfobacterales bacterium]|nr:hypothetical protein [Desulfobacterales bacterium]
MLGAPYGQVLDSGQLVLVFTADRGEFSIMYFEHRFPVDPREYPRILVRIEDRLAAHLGVQNPDLLELQSLIAAFGHLPERNAATPENIAERQRDKAIHKRRLAELCARVAPIGRHIEDSVAEINGRRGDPASFDALHELIKARAYRLSYWRVAADDINYRRFFDINDLAALRMERQNVFDATTASLSNWWPTARWRPRESTTRTASTIPAPISSACRVRGGCDPVPTDDTASGCAPRSIYLVGEKIVAGHERLPAGWPIHGTTGYRFANLVNGLFVDAAAESRIDRTYSTFIGERLVFDEVVHLAKQLIMKTSLSSELTVLANLLSRIAQASRHTCDFTLNSLRSALREIVACFPVYRTYITANERFRGRSPLCRLGRRPGEEKAPGGGHEHFRLRPPGLADGNRRRSQPVVPRCGDRLRHEVPAIHGAGHGQGHGGHRLLPLQPLGFPQRGGRRSAHLRNFLGGIPPGERGSGAALAPYDARDHDPRQQTLGGRPGPHRRHQRNARRLAARPAPLEPTQSQREAASGRRSGALAQRRIPVLPDPARRLAARGDRHGRARGSCGSGSRGTC